MNAGENAPFEGPSRIPEYSGDRDSVLRWFVEMQERDLLFHPDDDPRDIIDTRAGARLFVDDEVVRLREILSRMFEAHGDLVYQASWPVAKSAFEARQWGRARPG